MVGNLEKKIGNFILDFPSLEKFGNLPWWLGILLRCCENVNYKKNYRFDQNLNVPQDIGVKFDENVFCRDYKNTHKIVW